MVLAGDSFAPALSLSSLSLLGLAAAFHWGKGSDFKHTFPDGRGADLCLPWAEGHAGARSSGLKLSLWSEPANKAAGPTVSGVLSGAASQSPSEPQTIRLRGPASSGSGRRAQPAAVHWPLPSTDNEPPAPKLFIPAGCSAAGAASAARRPHGCSPRRRGSGRRAEPGRASPWPGEQLRRRTGKAGWGFTPPAVVPRPIHSAGPGLKEDPLPHWLP